MNITRLRLSMSPDNLLPPRNKIPLHTSAKALNLRRAISSTATYHLIEIPSTADRENVGRSLDSLRDVYLAGMRFKTSFKLLPRFSIWTKEKKSPPTALRVEANISSPTNCFIRWNFLRKWNSPIKRILHREKRRDRRCSLYRVFLACILSGSLEKERKLTDFHYKNIRFSRYDFFHRLSRNSAGKAVPDGRVAASDSFGRVISKLSCSSGDDVTDEQSSNA